MLLQSISTPQTSRGALAVGGIARLRAMPCALFSTTLAGLLVSACAGGSGPAAVLPTLPTAVSSDKAAVSSAPGAVIPVYARLARGLNTCWLRDGAALGKTYVLHATVAPPPTRKAEMIIHLRSKTGRRGLKAFIINLQAYGDATSVHSMNLKLPGVQGRRIMSDVARWGRGERACEPEANWVPDVAQTATVTPVTPSEPDTSGRN